MTSLPAALRSRAARSRALLEPLETRLLRAVDVTIDAGDRFQTIDGFGTSLGGYTLLKLVQSTKFQRMYYQDLGTSMLRVALQYRALKAPDGNLATPVYMGPNLQKNIAKFNFAEFNQMHAGTLARASMRQGLGDVKVIGAIWSPPHWMKGAEVSPWSGKPNGAWPKLDYTTYASPVSAGGSLIDTPDNLTQFGRYVAAFVKGFEQAYGVPLYALSIQNELAFREPYSSALYSPALYVKAIKVVAYHFRKHGITTKLIGPEDVGVGAESDPNILARQMSYIKAIRADREAREAIYGWAIHGYANDGVNSYRSPAMWSQYLHGRSGPGASWIGIKADRKPNWMTETSGEQHTWNGAMKLALSVQDALVFGNASAWVYWGISSSTTNWYDPMSLTAATDHTAMKYTALKHFSRYVRPGAVRLGATPSDPDSVYVSAFVHDKDQTVTTVLINRTTERQPIRLRLPGITMNAFDTGYLSTDNDTWNKLGVLRIRGGKAEITLPPRSMITLQGQTIRTGSIRGYYYTDQNINAQRDPGEKPIAGDKVFIDANRNGIRDARELFSTTAIDGAYRFDDLPAGTYAIRREVPPGWKLTNRPLEVTVIPGKTSANNNIGAVRK